MKLSVVFANCSSIWNLAGSQMSSTQADCFRNIAWFLPFHYVHSLYLNSQYLYTCTCFHKFFDSEFCSCCSWKFTYLVVAPMYTLSSCLISSSVSDCTKHNAFERQMLHIACLYMAEKHK